jgi:hypothetical protein
VPPSRKPWLTGPAEEQRASQSEAWDMIAGRIQPEFGGDAHYLDLIGVNSTPPISGKCRADESFAGMEVQRPPLGAASPASGRGLPALPAAFFIAETSHYGIGRAACLNEISSEVAKALEAGMPVGGVCLYPILDASIGMIRGNGTTAGCGTWSQWRRGVPAGIK